MIASGVLVLIALVTLVVGWGPGPDFLLFVSMVASIVAGVLLVLSFVKERKQRKASAEPAGEGIPAAPAEIEADLRSLDRGPEEEEPTEVLDAVPVVPEPAMAQSSAAPQAVAGESNAWDRAWAGMVSTPAQDDDWQGWQEEAELAGVAGKVAPKPRAQKRNTQKAKAAAGVAKPKAPARSAKPKPAARSGGSEPKVARPKPAAKKPSGTKAKATRPKSSAKTRAAAKPKAVSSRAPRSKPKP